MLSRRSRWIVRHYIFFRHWHFQRRSFRSRTILAACAPWWNKQDAAPVCLPSSAERLIIDTNVYREIPFLIHSVLLSINQSCRRGIPLLDWVPRGNHQRASRISTTTMMMRSLPAYCTEVFLFIWVIVATFMACRINVVSGSFQPIIPARTSARGTTSSRQLWEDAPLAFFRPRCCCTSPHSSSQQHTKMKEDDAETQREGTEDEPWLRKEKSFNPFDYNASSTSPQHATTRNTFSLRSIQMKALNERLFAATSIEERRTILTEEQEMLLAPIWDGDTAVGSNNNNGDSSIYQQCRSSEERFVAFDTNLTERIERAQNVVVKTILQEMKDFVMMAQLPPPPSSQRRPPPQQ
jgi:hypothetical protein